MVTSIRILGLVVCLLFSAVSAHAFGLKLMAEEYPPYSYRLGGESRGLFIDLVRMIQEKLGEKPGKITFYPWARGYKKLQSGTGDVLFPMCMTPERSAEFKFVGPVFWDDIYFYRKKGSGIELETVEDAKKIGTIAVTRYDIFHQNLVSMGYDNLDLSASPKCDFMKLLRGRADLVPMGSKAISYFFLRNPELDFKQLEKVGPSVFFTTNYIAFKKDTPDEVIEKWQAALDELKTEGEWQKLVDKYFPPDLVN
ncbi:ABC transporter substrate-binding protein [Desulfovibrio sp. JC010]|uniref:substrate-binding periplasmic protein n=1 Tax=Desulfovibrio sp. JC010 TaxID=2593641 RepID=UPI0013D129FC|nr:ABC transporter substrate-binding protein [Desulfovibrio sp. JC010]NDV25468.1 ABC transporter substrate-binding protein [Desulfovibrio sp. JC010]